MKSLQIIIFLEKSTFKKMYTNLGQVVQFLELFFQNFVQLDNNNCASSVLRSLCEIRGFCLGPRYFSVAYPGFGSQGGTKLPICRQKLGIFTDKRKTYSSKQRRAQRAKFCHFCSKFVKIKLHFSFKLASNIMLLSNARVARENFLFLTMLMHKSGKQQESGYVYLPTDGDLPTDRRSRGGTGPPGPPTGYATGIFPSSQTKSR